MDIPRLTALAHGGGCGCKLAPAVLRDLLAATPAAALCPNLLVGTETGDDAAVYRLRDDLALVATTDFFNPVVDDPVDFGRIAAANALSDVYAMGGTPILALALLGIPVDTLPVETAAQILAGGAAICAEAGIPIAGGHSIDSPEPLYGLVALGTVHPDRVMRNSGAQPGDSLVLTKPLGVGILAAALKQDRLDPAAYAALLDTATRLNRIGPDLARDPAVHAVTDVTGFGLLGHALEIARGSDLAVELDLDALPVLPAAAALAAAGISTGAAGRNWASYGDAVSLPPGLPAWRRTLLCDPQTSGGLLVSTADPDAALALAHAAGFAAAAIVGRLRPGPPGISVRR